MSILHDIQSDLQRSSKCDLVNQRMSGQICANIPKTIHNVHNSVGNSSFMHQLSHSKGGKRSLLGSLHDNSASSSKRRCKFVCLHDQGNIPGNDLAHNSYRLFSCRKVERPIHADRISSDLIYPACIVTINPVSKVQVQGLSKRERFSIVDGLNFGQVLSIFLNQISKPKKTPSSVSRIHPAPRSIIKGLISCLDSHINIFFRTSLHFCQKGLISWIGKTERLILE